MFWKLSFRQPCAIDSLLEKEDCTLDEILDEDDVLQECKSNNKKLTDFLVRPEILERLVKMVCFEPEEDVQDKVKFKYPHLACELLTSEVFSIVEQLSHSEHLLNMLWEFLDRSTPLNPLLASFISKVLTMLLNKEPSVMVGYIKAKEDFVTKFLTHLGTSAIMDLLLQMVADPVSVSDKTRTELSMWLMDEQLVERLADFIKDHKDDSNGDCVNAALTLCEMICISRKSFQLSCPSPLHELLESKQIVERLLLNMFSSESPSDVVVINGISVLLTLLRESVPATEYGVMPPVVSDTIKSEVIPSPGIANVLEVIIPWLKDFYILLTRKTEIPKMNTTVGVLDPPLGNMRLQVVKLISALLERNSPTVAQEIAELDLFNVLIELFFTFPWNNFLHMQVELCVQSVLCRTEEGEGEGGNNPESAALVTAATEENLKLLRVHLLQSCQFVSKLLEGASANDTAKARHNGRRQGYMGHLVRISNCLVKFGETDEQLKLSLDEETQQRWNNFVNGPLAEMNKRNETNLGGKQPLGSNMDDSDDEFDQMGPAGDSELEKAYQQYLDVKYIGSYLEEYGVEDELSASEEPFEESFTRLMDISRTVTADEEEPQQTSSMFAAVCSDRVQQFDDEEVESEEEECNDDDTWVDKDAIFSSPMDHRNNSASSSDDEDFMGNDSRAKRYFKNSPNIITQIPSSTTSNNPDKMEIENSFGVLSWKSDLTTDEDLSGVIPMDTGSGLSDWTKEPKSRADDSSAQDSEMWADFSKFPTGYGGPGGIRSTQSSSPRSVAPSQASPTTPSAHSSSSSSCQHDHLSPNGKGMAEAGDTISSASHSSRHNAVQDGEGGPKPLVDGSGAAEAELQENFSFLSKGMLSSGRSKEQGSSVDDGPDSRSLLVEQKRAEALEACNTYDKEVSTTLQQGSIET